MPTSALSVLTPAPATAYAPGVIHTCGPGDAVVTAGTLPAPYTGAAMSTSPDTLSPPTRVRDQAGDRVGDQDAPSPVSIKEAATRRGVSVNTIRRWIREGRLRTERIERPQGYVVYVHLPEHVPTPEQVSEEARDDHVPEQVPIVRDLARAEAMAAYTRSLLEPLVARMAEQEGIIRGLERENGRLATELAAARTSPPDPEPQPDPFLRPIPPTPNDAPWSALWQGRLAVASTLLLALLAASGWLRT